MANEIIDIPSIEQAVGGRVIKSAQWNKNFNNVIDTVNQNYQVIRDKFNNLNNNINSNIETVNSKFDTEINNLKTKDIQLDSKDKDLDIKIDTQVTNLNTQITNFDNKKADKATTLSGYGITDAYTKKETDDKLDTKVNNSLFLNELDKKANKTDVDTALNTKANKGTTLKDYQIGDAYTKSEINTSLSNKQNKLTFDTIPTSGSTNPVTSDGISKALDKIVTGNFDLSGYQTKLTFDTTPTADSTNPVTSDGIKKAIESATPNIITDATPTKDSTNPVQSGGVYTALESKQDTLTFDTAPTSGSMNPVTSGGIKIAIDNATPNLTYDAAPTSGSTNLVNSGAVYTAVSAKQNQITISTSAPKSTDGSNGDVWMVYEKNLRDISWSTGTDEEIVRAIAAADAGEIDLYNDNGWRVGDTRTVSLSAMEATGTYDGVTWSVGETHGAQDIELVLMNKGGITLSNGNECKFVVGMKDTLNEAGYMNRTDTSSGSWDGCARRSWCNGAFRQAIPDSLRGIFKQMQTITAETYNGSTLKTSIDYFALPAEREIFGTRSQSNTTEGESTSLTQFTWYATSANRIKKLNGSNSYWWERSPYANYSKGFCCVSREGGAGQTNATEPVGLSPFGCI